MRRESLRLNPLISERIVRDGIKSVRIDLVRKPSLLQSHEFVRPQYQIGVGCRVHCRPHAWVVREGISVQPEHGLSSLSFDLETLSLDVAHFQVDLAVLKTERGDITIAIEGYVLWVGRDEWINGYSIERAVNLGWDITKNNKVCDLALNATRQVRPVEVFGIWPFGL